MAKQTPSSKSTPKGDGSLQFLAVRDLHLDGQNPRFGGRDAAIADEAKLIDEIIGQHGIVDVISSISANGFFESEPLVGAINKGHGAEATILEGNRRLTACLVLAGDKRAARHERLRAQYDVSKVTEDTLIPVQVYDWSREDHRLKLLPYLGIRHIVGAQQWDSFAKAAWVAQTLETKQITLDQIRVMIGDDQSFIDRVVEGYYFVRQLIDTAAYDPANSLRRGRGSFQEFPFSWVYTALGYRNVRNFIALPQTYVTKPQPVPPDSLGNAASLLTFMFGGSGRNAAIEDSREIGALAKAIAEDRALEALREGSTVEQAIEKGRPPADRLGDVLKRADRNLEDGIALASSLTKINRESLDRIAEQAETIDSKVERLFEILDLLKASGTKRSRRGH